MRVDAADILRKTFWGGGAVSLATSGDDFHVLKCRPADKLEDGTVNFLDIIALKVSVESVRRLWRFVQKDCASANALLGHWLRTHGPSPELHGDGAKPGAPHWRSTVSDYSPAGTFLTDSKLRWRSL